MKFGVTIAVLAALIFLFAFLLPGIGASAETRGELLFKEFCASCHPDGGNILNPKKTLHKTDREAYDIRTADDIVKKMRNPGPFPTHPQEWAGMRMFDEKTLPNDDAKKISDYVLKAFDGQ